MSDNLSLSYPLGRLWRVFAAAIIDPGMWKSDYRVSTNWEYWSGLSKSVSCSEVLILTIQPFP